MQDGASSDQSFAEIINSESFQRMCLEMFEQNVFGIALIEDPLVQRVDIYFVSKELFEFFLLMPLENYLGRLKALQ